MNTPMIKLIFRDLENDWGSNTSQSVEELSRRNE
jgi:hypothetical protein